MGGKQSGQLIVARMRRGEAMSVVVIARLSRERTACAVGSRSGDRRIRRHLMIRTPIANADLR